MFELLTPTQMGQADQLTIDGGTPGIELMESAGHVLMETITKHFVQAQRILVLCGPGNNGGDGYVVARLLSKTGRRAEVYSPMGTHNLSGDALLAFQALPADVLQVGDPQWTSYDLIVDALFGAGLTRDIEGRLARIVRSVNLSPAKVLAVDLPSGVNGATGRLCGKAVIADATATFFRYKPGHFLFPGRSHCGKTEVGQIGIENSVLAEIGVDTFRNVPEFWQQYFPVGPINRGSPGSGAQAVPDLHQADNLHPFLDLASFDGNGDQLVDWIQGFGRDLAIASSQQQILSLFPQWNPSASKLHLARAAARELDTIINLSGPDIIIAGGDRGDRDGSYDEDRGSEGWASITENDRPGLSPTMDSDLLGSLIGDLCQHEMPRFVAVCAAVWIQLEASNLLASGGVSGDMEQAVNSVIAAIQSEMLESKQCL
ncbi:MAG: NAD(P)H-hydrate epimerase [Rhizobiaceae bacterium]